MATRHARQTRARGVTLIELMVTLSVMVVLTLIAAPSFADLIQRNRVAAEVNSLVGDLQFARSEAVRRGLPVSICVSADGATCTGGSRWHEGWIVFADPAGSGELDRDSVPLRVRARWAGTDTFVASAGTEVVTYTRQGYLANLPASKVTVALHTVPGNDRATRCVSLERVGRQSVQTSGAEGCV